jgi:hypothetical protein
MAVPKTPLSTMKVSPFPDAVINAEVKMNEGWTVYQQFNCANCGVKQTMPDANTFYIFGKCEECGHTTNIEKDGCNFMAMSGRLP